MKQIVLTILIFYVASFCKEMKPTLDYSNESSLSKWNLLWNDEFDSELTIDENWVAQNSAPGHIISSRWRENISVEDGFAVITNRKESKAGREWTSGSMTCKHTFKYGFFETRMKISAASGVNNSFWMYQWNKTDSLHSFELDMVEAHYPNKIRTNVHDRGLKTKNLHTQKSELYLSQDVNLYSDFHIYALEWDEYELKFYFDGKIIRTLPNDICHSPANMVLGTAVMKWAGEVTDQIDNTSMMIDYVRVWERE